MEVNTSATNAVSFGDLAARYLEARGEVDRLKRALCDAETTLAKVDLDVRCHLDQNDYKGRAAGSRGVASARGDAWWSGPIAVEVLPLEVIG